MPGLGVLVFDLRPFRGINQNAAIGIEQRRIALGEDFETSSVPEIGPRRAVRQRVGVHRGSDIERCAHALAEIAVPTGVRIGLDAGRLPQPKLHPIRAAVVATACKCRRALGDPFQGLARVFKAANVRWIAAWSDHDEVVVHDVAAVDTEPVRNKFVFPGTIMNEECVGVATGTDGQRLTGSDSDHVNRDTACRSENRQDMAE